MRLRQLLEHKFYTTSCVFSYNVLPYLWTPPPAPSPWEGEKGVWLTWCFSVPLPLQHGLLQVPELLGQVHVVIMGPTRHCPQCGQGYNRLRFAITSGREAIHFGLCPGSLYRRSTAWNFQCSTLSRVKPAFSGKGL